MIGWLGGNSRGNVTFGVARRIPQGCQTPLGCLSGIIGLLLLVLILAAL